MEITCSEPGYKLELKEREKYSKFLKEVVSIFLDIIYHTLPLSVTLYIDVASCEITEISLTLAKDLFHYSKYPLLEINIASYR